MGSLFSVQCHYTLTVTSLDLWRWQQTARQQCS